MAKNRNEKPVIPILMMAGGVVIIAIILVWQFISTNRGATPTPIAALPAQSELPYPEVTRISVTDAKSAYDAGSAVFIDVRDAESFQTSHIPGAINIELALLPAHLAELDPSQAIITYCT